MERLKLDFSQLNKALKTVAEAFEIQQELAKLGNPRYLVTAEDSTIQRFEYTYEMFWKYLKLYLETIHNQDKLDSPRKIFNTCFKMNICSLTESNIFRNMVDDRNETSHTYNIESTRLILTDIPHYYEVMVAVTKRLDPDNL